MTKALYMEDSYLKEFESEIETIEEKKVILKETAFYPTSGGQPNDTGKLIQNNQEYEVIDVKKEKDKIIHYVNKEGLKEGKVQGKINWERRYNLMKAHTATHTLCNILHTKTKSMITGNQLYEDKIRIDFNLETYDKELLQEIVEEANKKIKENKEVTQYFLPREEALKLPGALKLANILPPNIKELRIIEIKDLDTQIDGGTHVKNTSEINKIKLIKTENKGKNNRRITASIN